MFRQINTQTDEGGIYKAKTRALFVLALVLTSCSAPSVLIRKNDETFRVAQDRLEKTAKLVRKSTATEAERSLFLQGEGFYRYRFEPPERNSLSFLAEAAASITDFPAFQSLAGSLSLLDIRVRANDSAIQLWETLLRDYPDTPLKPLTLYRLGWAYRNAAAAGLPRESPDDAFNELVKEAPDSQLGILAKQAENTEWKSKSTAATRSLLPGLGQIYVGETGSGILRMSVAVAAAAAVVIPILIARRRSSDLSWKNDWPLLASGVGGLIVLSFDYTSSYEDAMRGVVQWNERTEGKFEAEHPEAP